MPGGERQAGDDVAHYQNVARICERALLDVLFLADSPSFTDDGRSPTRSLDPVVLITACALATEHLGLVLTASTTFSQPYNLARSLLTLDQVSRGRVGWNIVTTADAAASLNFGMTEMPSSDLRYEMAADFTAVVRALWDSWDDGALVGDVDTGVWADADYFHQSGCGRPRPRVSRNVRPSYSRWYQSARDIDRTKRGLSRRRAGRSPPQPPSFASSTAASRSRAKGMAHAVVQCECP